MTQALGGVFTIALRLLAGFVWGIGASGSLAAAEVHIHRAEPITISIQKPTSGSVQKSIAPLRTSFSAFGRRFDLDLEPNTPLLSANSALPSGYSPYRGKVANVAGSWVRLTRTPAGWTGALWDGIELYSIAATRSTAKFLDTPLSKPEASTVIYRMSETDSGLTDQFCGVGDAHNIPLSTDVYRTLKHELRSQQALGAMPSEAISVYVVADAEFAAAITSDGGDPRGEMLARMNIVDGIFSDQVGVSVMASDIVVLDAPSPFTSTAPATLLDQVSTYRASTAFSGLRGITHLMTGKDLDGSTAGIAFRGALCSTRQSVSLSEGWRDPTTSALIAAHEFGHNFGAPHDGEAGSACASESTTFLMAPILNGSSTFSSCSLAQMQPIIAAATCLQPPSTADVAVTATTSPLTPVVGHAFDVPITVTASDSAAANDVQLTVSVSGALLVSKAAASGGSCTIANGVVSCPFASLVPGDSRQVTVTLQSSDVNEAFIYANVTASNDRQTTDNHVTVKVDAVTAADATIAVTPTTPTAYTHAPLTFSVDVHSLGPDALVAPNITIDTASLALTAATIEAGTCTLKNSTATCSLATLPANESRRIQLTGSGAGAGILHASVTTAAINDLRTDDDVTSFDIVLQPTADVGVNVTSGSTEPLVGESFTSEIVATADGIENMDDVTVRVKSGSGLVIDSILPSQGHCITESTGLICHLGSIAAGASATIAVTAHATTATHSFISGSLVSAGDDDLTNDTNQLSIVAKQPHELSVPAQMELRTYDTVPTIVTIPIESTGRSAIDTLVLTATMPTPLVIQSAFLAETACEIDADKVTCTRSTLDAGAVANLKIQVLAEQPGEYSGTLTASAANDTDPTDNTTAIFLHVLPQIDVSVSGPATVSMTTAVSQNLTYVLTTNRHDVGNVALDFDAPSSLRIDSVSAAGGTCSVHTNGASCTWTAIAANTVIPVNVSVTPVDSETTALIATVTAAEDTNNANNQVTTATTALRSGDVSVAVNPSSVSGVVQQAISFPTITVAAEPAVDATQLTVTFDANVTIEELTTDGGSCAAQTTGAIVCDLGTVFTDQPRHVRFAVVTRESGTVNATVRVASPNDTDDTNNVAVVAINTGPMTAANSNAGSRRHGGGSFDMLLTGALALLCLGARRGKRASHAAAFVAIRLQ